MGIGNICVFILLLVHTSTLVHIRLYFLKRTIHYLQYRILTLFDLI